MGFNSGFKGLIKTRTKRGHHRLRRLRCMLCSIIVRSLSVLGTTEDNTNQTLVSTQHTSHKWWHHAKWRQKPTRFTNISRFKYISEVCILHNHFGFFHSYCV